MKAVDQLLSNVSLPSLNIFIYDTVLVEFSTLLSVLFESMRSIYSFV